MKKTKATEEEKKPLVEYDWSQSEVTGFENTTSADLGIPFLVILQRGSPEVDKTNPEYPAKRIDGAEQGDILHTLSKETLHKFQGTPLSFVPCTFQKMFVEWKPRESGGGIVTSHTSEAILAECRRNEKNQDVLRNGNIVVTTCYFFGLLLREDGERQKAVVGMTSTQLKKSRQWLNMAMGIKFPRPDGTRFTPPLFSHVYHLSTIPESNNKGSWFGWKIALSGPVSDIKLIEEAREFGKQAGKQQVSLPAHSETDEQM